MSSEEIKILNQYTHARLRTEMYLGSRTKQTGRFPIYDQDAGHFVTKEVEYVPAVLTAIREAIDNALDELSFIGGGKIWVQYDSDGFFSVEDNGRGIPIHYNEEHSAHMATIAVSETKAGRNFDERGNVGGANGLGISIVNMVSDNFKLRVQRDDKIFEQSFQGGNDDLVIHEPVIAKAKKKTGTYIEFSLSRKVFKDISLPDEMLESLLRLISAAQPSIKVYYNGKMIPKKGTMATSLFGVGKNPIEIKLSVEDEAFDFYLANTGESSEFSLINNIPAINGSIHMDRFRNLFSNEILEGLKRESKKRKLNPTKADILENLQIFSVVRMNAPDFDSQAKTRLINGRLEKLINDNLSFDVAKLIKTHPEFVEDIYKRCAARMGAIDQRDLKRQERLLKKVKIPNLSDATSRDRSNCTLAIFEGRSAAGDYAAVRNPKIQGSMPLRGKILNCWNLGPKEALKSDTISQMCAAIGIVPGKKVDPKALRYRQVQVYTDADSDGLNIAALINAFFYRFWEELFDQQWLDEHNDGKPFLVIALTPLIAIKKGKVYKYFYPGEEFSMDEWKSSGWSFVKRLKGLAAMSITDWRAHVNDNSMKIPVYDDEFLKSVLDVNFNNERADDRKALLEGSATVHDFMV